jgi:leucine dehydrogenase
MEIIDHNSGTDHERVIFGRDDASGYRGIIAIHNTRLGPALGGARFWNYASETDALVDVLRLSRGMTYKNALAGLPFGGGKSIIIGDNRTPLREDIFRAHGRFVETLGGSYLTAEDVGTTTADMEFVLRELREAGAKLIVTDVDDERIERVVSECEAERVAPEEIYAVGADIFAPCALGGILNDETIPQLKVEIVAGAANNQLLEARHGETLAARGILYAPDYAANAGGVINGCIELLDWKQSESRAKVEAIYDTLLEIFRRAEAEGVSTSEAADKLAEARLNYAHA